MMTTSKITTVLDQIMMRLQPFESMAFECCADLLLYFGLFWSSEVLLVRFLHLFWVGLDMIVEIYGVSQNNSK